MFNIENRRYMGNKTKLMEVIERVIVENCEGDTFLDIFGGTGSVTNHFIHKMKKCIINDILFSNEVIYKGFFLQMPYDLCKIESFISEMSIIDDSAIEGNYISDNYGDKYFRLVDAKKIGYIREEIEKRKQEFNEKEYNILLASLVYSMDRLSNTVGHYEAFLRPEQNTKGDFKYELIIPIETDVEIEIHREDANKLARKIKSDIVFLDPPYNSRDYGSYYHVLEQTVKWDKIELVGKTAKPKVKEKSEYCTNNAADSLKDLIDNLDCKYILVTYNNSFSTSQSSRNKISYEQMIEILESKGDLEVFAEDFKPFNSGKTKIKGHKELIFFVKVR